MKPLETNREDAESLALAALVWILQDEGRADRLLALTGLTADDLRERAGERSVLAAILGFLEAHEPDLLACARDIETTPLALVDARARLEA
ncbi:DUF3572 domain-containing protein [Sphingomonas cavernae]|uniref:DUF3572 family protein n=1 Tax=Sphingomonas cavernae TaxID=2320861 RepID=A0A418WS36_9SPHN|nr:DUF3572 domain-containing protein [Sphingomonas cavernae]RJF94068.1 DUF3572 family protein [Sphingomonas cavernae]